MAYQTQMTHNGRQSADSRPRRVARNVSTVAHDVVGLAELQMKLLKADMKEASGQSITPIILLGVGAALALSSMPLLLLAMAHGLTEAFNLPLWGSLLISVATGLVVGGLLALLGMKLLSSRWSILQRSQEELAKNIAWIKQTLKNQRQEEKEAVHSEW